MDQKRLEPAPEEAAERRAWLDAFIERLQRDPSEVIEEAARVSSSAFRQACPRNGGRTTSGTSSPAGENLTRRQDYFHAPRLRRGGVLVGHMERGRPKKRTDALLDMGGNFPSAGPLRVRMGGLAGWLQRG
jgi:hypothetical protein